MEGQRKGRGGGTEKRERGGKRGRQGVRNFKMQWRKMQGQEWAQKVGKKLISIICKKGIV